MKLIYCGLYLLRQSVKHRKMVFITSLMMVLVPFVYWIQHIPKKYKSSALFNFHSDFSKIPASSEFFNEIYDPNEIRAEKEAILLGVLSDDFLFHIAQKYISEEAAEQEWVVQGLRRDIRFVPLSRTTYQLVVVQRTGEISQSIAWEVLDRLDDTLRSERLTRMKSVYDSISKQLNELTLGGQDGNVSPGLEAVQVRIQAEIAHLEQFYTNDHPKLMRLRQQLQSLRETKNQSERERQERGQLENWVSLRGILVTRQALLQVALRMEDHGSVSHIKIVKEPDLPLWPAEPQKNLLLASALLTSLICAAATSAMVSCAAELHLIFPRFRQGWMTYLSELGSRSKNPPDQKGCDDV